LAFANLFSANPLFLAALIYSAVGGTSIWSSDGVAAAMFVAFYGGPGSWLARPCAPRLDVERVDSAVDAATLAAVVARRMARALPAYRRAPCMGKGRPPPGKKLALPTP